METNNITASSGNVAQLVTAKDHSVAANKQQGVKQKQIQDVMVKMQRKEESEQKSEKLDETKIGKAVAEMNSFFQNENRKLSFSVNKEADMVVIEVKDSETDKTIRQIPSEVVVKLAEHLNNLPDENSGMLLAENA